MGSKQTVSRAFTPKGISYRLSSPAENVHRYYLVNGAVTASFLSLSHSTMVITSYKCRIVKVADGFFFHKNKKLQFK